MSQNVDSRFRCEKDKQNKCREKSAESHGSKEASSDMKINFFCSMAIGKAWKYYKIAISDKDY